MNKQKIEKILDSNRIVLFMKGDKDAPKCGFSMQAVSTLKSVTDSFIAVDILQDPDLRQDLKDYSGWPTYPQLYVGGELIGGSDIIKQLNKEGKLQSIVSEVT